MEKVLKLNWLHVPKIKLVLRLRKKRFESVTKDLKVTRAISLLVEEMKAIGSSNGRADSTELMVPVAHDERSPVLLFMGGGMGAGKSTVLKDLLNEYIPNLTFQSWE